MENTLYTLLSHWNFSNPAATAEKFRALLQSETDAQQRAAITTQIVRTFSLQQKFEEAQQLLNEMKSEDLSPRVKALWLLEQGRVYNSSGRKAEAVPPFIEAMQVAQTNGEEYLAVDAAHMLAIADEPQKQIEWSERALQMCEASSDARVRGWLGPLYNNLGWTYHDLANYERALQLFQKSLAWRQERQDEQGTRIAHWCIARLYRSTGRLQEALAVQRMLEQQPNPSGYVFEEIGELLLLQQQQAESKPYFQKAYQLLSQDGWLQTNEAARLQRLKELGE